MENVKRIPAKNYDNFSNDEKKLLDIGLDVTKAIDNAVEKGREQLNKNETLTVVGVVLPSTLNNTERENEQEVRVFGTGFVNMQGDTDKSLVYGMYDLFTKNPRMLKVFMEVGELIAENKMEILKNLLDKTINTLSDKLKNMDDKE